MAENSAIEWTHHTFNPWRGCTKVSAGCANCYAETMSGRNPKTLGTWGPNGTRVVAAESYWREPVKWDRAAHEAGEKHRVFCASFADVFEDWKGPMTGVAGGTAFSSGGDWRINDSSRPLTMNDVRNRLLKLVAATPNLNWLLLTKRPQNILTLTRRAIDPFEEAHGNEMADPNGLDVATFADLYPNVWLGTSVEDRQHGLPRIDVLRRIPAAVRFLSVEPLLEDLGTIDLTGIHWVIVGGESGHSSRPMHPDWVRSLRDQCQAAGVAFFFKQYGEWVPDDAGANLSPKRNRIVIGADGKPRAEGEANLAAYRFVGLNLVGKKAAGRLLDGREWNEFPGVRA